MPRSTPVQKLILLQEVLLKFLFVCFLFFVFCYCFFQFFCFFVFFMEIFFVFSFCFFAFSLVSMILPCLRTLIITFCVDVDAREILDWLNTDHAEDVREFCKQYANVPDVSESFAYQVDRLGFNVFTLPVNSNQWNDLRLPFPFEVAYSHCPVQRHTRTRTHARTRFARTHARARTHACTHARTHACTYMRTHTRAHALMHARTRMVPSICTCHL